MEMEKKSRLDELVNDISAVRRLFGVIWNNRNVYIKYSIIGAVLSLVISFSIPKTYSVDVMLAPENNNQASGLANLVGLDFSLASSDAYTVNLYPMIISSKDFVVDLFDTNLKVADFPEGIEYYDYIKDHQKISWWGYPAKWLGKLFSGSKSEDSISVTDDFGVRKLEPKQQHIYQVIKKKVRCNVNAASGIITVTVYDQNPEVAVLVADTVVHNLNRFILDYRTRKARNDYEYIDGMCTAAREKYIDCQAKHADFVSSHASIHSAIYKKEQQYLENELHLAYSAYSSMVSQLEVARAKLLEATPVYTIIESAYLPVGADSPRKKLILVLFVFLACAAATVRIFYKEFYHKK